MRHRRIGWVAGQAHPGRGTRNEPAYVVETARFVAGLRDCSFDEVAEATARNAARLFGFTL